MPGLQETVPVSPRRAAAGHGDGQGAWAVISRDKSLHLTISPSHNPRCCPGKGQLQLPPSSRARAGPQSLYLAAAVGDDWLEEGLRSFLDGPHDAGDVDDGCPAATQPLFCALLGSLLQQGQERLGKSILVRCLCLQPATATLPAYGREDEEEQWEAKRAQVFCCNGPACSQLAQHSAVGLHGTWAGSTAPALPQETWQSSLR